MRSETHPNKGRVTPFATRSMVNASGQRRKPEHAHIRQSEIARENRHLEVTIRPDVDIIDIITNSSQKSGVRSMLRVFMSGHGT